MGSFSGIPLSSTLMAHVDLSYFLVAGLYPEKQTIFEGEFLVDDKRSVCVIPDVFFEIFVIVQNVLDHAAQEGNIGA